MTAHLSTHDKTSQRGLHRFEYHIRFFTYQAAICCYDFELLSLSLLLDDLVPLCMLVCHDKPLRLNYVVCYLEA